MTYRRRASALHAARAGIALAWLLSLTVAVLMQSNPIVLGALAASILLAGHAARLGPEMRRSLRLAVPLALTICVINALVSRDGYTVIWRFGSLPILGQTNVTLEAVVYGAVLGMRAAALVMIGALYSAAVDPDEVLRMFRRVSFRSAVTAAVATRLVPVLVRDSHRLADAQRCRPGAVPGRVQLLRAGTSGVFDRALDVAAALEVRGYSITTKPGRAKRGRPWSRHDLAFAASAGATLTTSIVIAVGGLAPFGAYPGLRLSADARTLVAAACLVVCVLAPLGQRRGVAG
jgi:energy-coupling factor transport system permease protein